MSDRQDPRASGRSQRQRPLSYKFQRLREQIRTAVIKGEFQGRLPGERELGRLYNANAKTINKALSDLSAEGLLIRRIGRGTFVAGRNGNAVNRLAARKVHIVMRSTENGSPYAHELLTLVASRLRDRGHEVLIQTLPDDDGVLEIPIETMREAETVISLTPDPFADAKSRLSSAGLIEMTRRQIPLVLVGAIGDGVRRNAVAPDYTDAGFRLTQHLIQAGSRRLAILGNHDAGREFDLLHQGCRTAAARYSLSIERLSLVKGPGGDGLPERSMLSGSESKNGSMWPIGLICAGKHAAMAIVDEHTGGGPALLRRVIPACVTEPGNRLCERFDLTSYEVAIQDIAEQTAQLAAETRAGDVPIEIAVPGKIELRGSLSAARLMPPDRSAESPLPPSLSGESGSRASVVA